MKIRTLLAAGALMLAGMTMAQAQTYTKQLDGLTGQWVLKGSDGSTIKQGWDGLNNQATTVKTDNGGNTVQTCEQELVAGSGTGLQQALVCK